MPLRFYSWCSTRGAHGNLAQICVASGCLTSGSLGMGSSVREKVLPVREKVLPVREKVSSVYQKGQIYSKLAMC